MPDSPSPAALPRIARALQDRLGPADWFDAHTHIGQNDPDGMTATAEDILGGLDAAGHRRALTFAMHEPDGYREANDVVLDACRTSDGRLLPLARIAPGSPGALDEARRCLDAGALGFKLHPRSDAFALTHPDVDAVVALAAERRGPVLFHAGRGIPQLSEAAVALAERHPDARLILAHAAVSDLGLLAEPAARLPNLFFDTSWWHPTDLLQLFATVPPGQILYASDMPYGPGTFSAFAFLRCCAAVGIPDEAVREMVGPQLDRIVTGAAPADLGPAVGTARLGERSLPLERVASYTAVAMQLGYRGVDATEALALARCGAQTRGTGPEAELLRYADALIARAEVALPAAGDDLPRRMAAVMDAVVAGLLAATPSAGVPPVAL
ncbi:amidohydrolase family protein [Patulibacter sp. S7RM1-6]